MLQAVQLGRNSGLRVSRLCLGTMNFGEPGRGHQGDWTLDAEAARPIVQRAIEHGLFYFDCADVYGLGASEEVVGKLLREFAPREAYVLATKVAMPMGRGANQGGLSRKHIMEGVDASLRRLDLDYIDHLVIHRHPHGVPGHVEVPIEETMEALHDLVRAGKVAVPGRILHVRLAVRGAAADGRVRNGWTPFVSMQNHYNLIYREEEREMIPYCAQSGVALTPWSPLARGILAGSYQGGFGGGSTQRSKGADRRGPRVCIAARWIFRSRSGSWRWPTDTAATPAQIAIAWLLSKPAITSPIVGVSRVAQLDQLVAAAEIQLDPADVRDLEETLPTGRKNRRPWCPLSRRASDNT